MKKEFLALSVCMLLLIISFSGCVEESTVTAEEIKEKFLQAVENITSYKYSSEVVSAMTMINESGTNTTDTVGIQNGEVDIFNRKMKQNTTGNATGTSEIHGLVYIFNDVLYSGTDTDGNVTWASMNLSSIDTNNMTWNSYSLLEMQAFYLESGYEQIENIEIRRLADETVEGIDCYVLHLTAFENQSGEDELGAPFPVTGYTSYSFALDYWIAKDGYLLIKGYLNATSDSSGYFTPAGADRLITISKMEIIFNDYNVPVIIELPPEAED